MSKKDQFIEVWIGHFKNENDLREKYLFVDYEEVENSKFELDAGIDFLDEDYFESWWFNELSIENITNSKEHLFNQEYFFDSLINECKKLKFIQFNIIHFWKTK